ncbi:MAG: hypothetical protein FWG63_01365 [Defluviitaleaceae bacterium]|nr:hypothetical protein [Defluviitaleaceae bacterium]
MIDTKVINLIERIKKEKLRKADIKAKIEKLENQLKAEMETRNQTEAVFGIFKVFYKEVETNRIDTTSLKKELPEIAQRFMTTIFSKRLDIR